MPLSQASFNSDHSKPELSPDERTLLQRQLETKLTDAGYFALFRYATVLDLVIYYASMFASAAGGIGTPTMMVRLLRVRGNHAQC